MHIITIFITTFFMITVAEFFDKTQILAMAFATKYSKTKVIIGVILGIVAINFLSIIFGATVGSIGQISDLIKLLSSFLFIFFALTSIKNEKDDKIEGKSSKNPILAVALSFFLAEFGDKTQLSTISIAANYPQDYIPTFLGSTLGLLVANLFGVFFGSAVLRKIPKHIVKWITVSIFAAFGFFTMFQSLPKLLPNILIDYFIFASIIFLTSVVGYLMERRNFR